MGIHIAGALRRKAGKPFATMVATGGVAAAALMLAAMR
jgi:hypothetical protein